MKSFSSKLVTKVCLDPHCEAVIHRMPKGDPVCIDCGRKAVEINNDTFQKKFAGSGMGISRGGVSPSCAAM